MKNKIKRITAALLLGVMLFGGIMTAQAAEIQSSSHAHKYNRDEFVTTIRSVNATHQYVDSSGVTRTCTVTTYLDQYNKVCSCGYVLSTYTTTRVKHSASHS